MFCRARSTISHLVFFAAGVGDQGFGAHQSIEMPDVFENAADGLGEENQIGLWQRLPSGAPRSMAPAAIASAMAARS